MEQLSELFDQNRAAARAAACAVVEIIRFDGAHFRRDIAAKALVY